jgi:hypothetical protein
MKIGKRFTRTIDYLFNVVKPINDSKIFAGLVILTLNLSSKLLTLPMSRTVEAVVKNSLHFSQYVLVFAMAWMGTRDILIALLVTSIFALIMVFLFNEKSVFCILPKSFVAGQIRELENFEGNPDVVTKEELELATKTFEKAQRLMKESNEASTK